MTVQALSPTISTRTGAVAIAARDLAAGGIVVLSGGEAPNGHCELVCAAVLVTPSVVNFMVREGRGLVSLALTPADCDRLDLTPMGRGRNDHHPDFTVSIEAAEGVSTGISAADRARTILVASDPDSSPDDLVAPGHVLPVRAAGGGSLERRGHPEAAVDLARLAGLRPAAVVCQILNDDGTAAWIPDMERFRERHRLAMVSVDQVAAERWRREGGEEAGDE